MTISGTEDLELAFKGAVEKFRRAIECKIRELMAAGIELSRITIIEYRNSYLRWGIAVDGIERYVFNFEHKYNTFYDVDRLCWIKSIDVLTTGEQ